MIEPRLHQVPPQASQVTAASSTIDPPDWVLGPSHIVTSLPPPRGGCLGNVTKPALSHTLRAQLPKSQLHAHSVGRVTKSTLLIALRARASSKSQCPSVSYKSGNPRPLERVKPLLISILNCHPLHTLVSHPHAHILTHSTHPSLALPAHPHTLSPITPSFLFNRPGLLLEPPPYRGFPCTLPPRP